MTFGGNTIQNSWASPLAAAKVESIRYFPNKYRSSVHNASFDGRKVPQKSTFGTFDWNMTRIKNSQGHQNVDFGENNRPIFAFKVSK